MIKIGSIKLNIQWDWLLLLGVLSVILYTPLMGDDLPMFQWRVDNPLVNKISLHRRAMEIIHQFLPMGRLTVLSFYYTEWVFWMFQTPIQYKIWLLFLNFVTVAVFVWWLEIIGFKIHRGLLFICISIGIQLRLNYHDSYSSYAGLCQLFNSIFFIATGNWVKGYTHFRWTTLMVSLISSFILFFISEHSLMLTLIIPLLFWISDKLKGKRWNFPRVLLFSSTIWLFSIIYLITISTLRSKCPPSAMYSGLQANINISAMAWLEVKQIYASLPLTNLTNTPRIPLRILHQLSFWDVLIVAMLILAAIVQLKKNFIRRPPIESSNTPQNTRLMILIGTFLISITAIFILPSAKYQAEITWGNGYLSLMMQNLGMALIIYGLLFRYLLQVPSSRTPVFTAFGIIIIGTFLFNHSLSKKYKYKKEFPSRALWEWIKDGGLKSLPDTSMVIMQTDFYYRSPMLYQNLMKAHSQKRIHVVDYEGEMAKSGPKTWEMNSSGVPMYKLMIEPGDTVRWSLMLINPNELQNIWSSSQANTKWVKKVNPIQVISADLD